jgi:hypothetical protein
MQAIYRGTIKYPGWIVAEKRVFLTVNKVFLSFPNRLNSHDKKWLYEQQGEPRIQVSKLALSAIHRCKLVNYFGDILSRKLSRQDICLF